MNEFNITGQIDALLAERRPDRYDRDGGDEWLDGVAETIASLIPATEAQYRSARLMVGNRERVKTQRTNRLLRQIHASRQLPLDWLETINLPLAVGKERVALRAATSADFKEFANVERRAAANEFTTRNETCEAAEWIADEMVVRSLEDGRGLNDFLDIGEEVAS